MLTLTVEDITTEANIRHDVRSIEGLASSIDRVGLLQPLIVRLVALDDMDSNGSYVLVAGHRRLAAVRSLGWDVVDCVINERVENAAEVIEAQYVENTQRLSLTDWEEAQVAYDLKLEGLTQPQVAEAMGLAKGDVSKLQKIAKNLRADDSLEDGVADRFGRDALLELAGSDVVEHAGEVLQLLVDGQARSIDQAETQISDNLELAAFRDDNAEQIKEWSEAGIEVTYKNPVKLWGKKDQWGSIKNDPKVAQLEAKWDGLDVSIKNHIKLDCHMIWIDEALKGWGAPNIHHYCMDAKSHTQKGKSEVKATDAAKDQARKEKDSVTRKEERDAKTLRRQQADIWMGKLGKQTDVHEMAVAQALTTWREDHIRTAIAMLGLTTERPVGADYAWYQKRLATYLDDKFGDDEKAIRRWKVRMIQAYRYIDQRSPIDTAKEQLFTTEVPNDN